MHRIALVMAGGSGERFWPLSRANKPKQLLRLTHPTMSMLEEAIARVTPVVGEPNVFVATSETLMGSILEAGAVPGVRVFGEPDRRNTLGALVWATASLISLFPLDWADMTVAVLTADHKIDPPDRFAETVTSALEAAEQNGGLVTIGIKPTRPETGYGYIEVDRSTPVGRMAFQAKSFREKPSADQAAQYVTSGNFLWNSGMFFWTLRAFYEQLEKAEPQAAETLMEIAAALSARDSAGAHGLFRTLPNLSIDYALMEKADQVYVLESDFQWDDVGAWDALDRTLPTSEGNVVSGGAVLLDTQGSVVYNEANIVTCVLGMEDVIVVTTPDAVLVCPKSRAQDVKRLVEELKHRKPDIL